MVGTPVKDLNPALTQYGDDVVPDQVAACGSGAVAYVRDSTQELVIVPTTCHRWDCPKCSHIRQAQAMNRVRAGRPERFLTLTLRPNPAENLDYHIDLIRTAFKRLVARIRRNYQGFEYLAALELQKNGTPHIHCVFRGVYIPQKWLSSAWHQLTNAYIVHVRQVDKIPGICNEVCKYLTKTAADIQKAAPGVPLIVMSRGWLPPDYQDEKEEHEPWDYKVYLHLPGDYLVDLIATIGGIVTVNPKQPHRLKVSFLPQDQPQPMDTTLCRHPISAQKLQLLINYVFVHRCARTYDLRAQLELIDIEARAKHLEG